MYEIDIQYSDARHQTDPHLGSFTMAVRLLLHVPQLTAYFLHPENICDNEKVKKRTNACALLEAYKAIVKTYGAKDTEKMVVGVDASPMLFAFEKLERIKKNLPKDPREIFQKLLHWLMFASPPPSLLSSLWYPSQTVSSTEEGSVTTQLSSCMSMSSTTARILIVHIENQLPKKFIHYDFEMELCGLEKFLLCAVLMLPEDPTENPTVIAESTVEGVWKKYYPTPGHPPIKVELSEIIHRTAALLVYVKI
jgi:hypothetical protein